MGGTTAAARRRVSVRTIRAVLDRQACVQGGRTYLVAPETGREYSYAALQAEVQKFAAWLGAMGLESGDRVGFYCANGWQTAAIFLGTMYAGYVSVPINLVAQPAQLAYVIGHSGLRLAFADREHAPRLAEAARAAGHELEIIVIDVDAPSLFRADRRLPFHAAAVAESAPALLMYTSGTTGQPKGCVLTQRNVVSGGLFTRQAHDLGPQDRVLSSLPLYHINGQIVATVGPLVHGGSVVAPHRFSVSQFWDLLTQYRCTWFNVVPTIISYLAANTEIAGRGYDLSGVRFGRSASAPLPPELHRAFEAKFGLSIIETMGMTETCAPIFSNPLDAARRKIGSVGQPVGNQGRVMRLDGGPCAAGEVGEIQVRGDNVMREYYRNPEETDRAFTADGWLRTGDLGYLDDDGFLTVTGRIKELIIKGGENIAPREIDDVLHEHPAILEAAVVGIPDPHYGQEILAGVVLKPGARADEAELRRFCEAQLGRFKTPREFRFFDELPKGPSGKVQRLKLLEH